jgi:hypothetical protein
MDKGDLGRRWYDKDPILSKAMKILETTDDKLQIKVAINLIKIIIEHNIEADTFRSVDDLLCAVEEGRCEKGNERWYDLDRTLRTAIQMLEKCPDDMQNKIAREVADLIREKVRDSYERAPVEDGDAD